MDSEKIFYINDDGNKVYDTKKLPEDDPIRLFVEDQYCKISYKRLADIEKAYFSDAELSDNPYDWYWSPYYKENEDLLLNDTDEKRDLIENRFDIRVGDKEYKELQKEMIEHDIYESYLD